VVEFLHHEVQGTPEYQKNILTDNKKISIFKKLIGDTHAFLSHNCKLSFDRHELELVVVAHVHT